MQETTLRELSADDAAGLKTIGIPSELDEANITGAILALPKGFFYDVNDPKGPGENCWGYVVKVGQKIRRSDKPAYSLACHDGVYSAGFYLRHHPGFKPNEQHRYLTHSDVKVLKLN